MSKTKKILFTSFLLVFAITIVPIGNIYAQTSQETLGQYMSDLQRHPDDFALKEKIIRHVRTMKRMPSVPEEARRHHVMAVTMLKDARDAREFASAVEEFKATVLAAPWWPTAYRDLAVALKGAERYPEAIEALRLYLLTEPSEKDARQAQDQIYVLEAKKQNQTDDRAAEAETRRQATRINILAGTWENEAHNSRFQVTVRGNNIDIVHTAHGYGGGVWNPVACSEWNWSGTVTDGANITGTFKWNLGCSPIYKNTSIITRPMTGAISADRKRIQLRYGAIDITAMYEGGGIANWRETERSSALVR